MFSNLNIAFFLGLLSLTAAAPIDAPSHGCPDVQIITCRASTEAPGEGVLSTLAASIQSSSEQTVSRASVDYPATLTDYPASSASGVVALKQQLAAAVESCPNSKIVLLGYSQGAQVVGDVMAGGGGGELGATTAPVASEYSSHVTAIILFGDPRHVDNEPFQHGTDKDGGEGLFPRPTDESLTPFSKVIASWCDTNDLFCASGDSITVHMSYVSLYSQAATEWVLKKIGN